MPSKILTNQIFSQPNSLIMYVCYKGISNAAYIPYATRFTLFGLGLTSLMVLHMVTQPKLTEPVSQTFLFFHFLALDYIDDVFFLLQSVESYKNGRV